MGLKFNDILIKGHDHKKTLNYFYGGHFEELFEEKIKEFQWGQKSFPMARKLGIDKHEICSWESHGYRNHLILESNKKVPWLRLACRDSNFYVPKLTDKLMDLNPEALVANFSHISTSDSALLTFHQREEFAFIAWKGDKNKIEYRSFNNLDLDNKTLNIPSNLMPNGEKIIALYWKELFPEIPLRYDLSLSSQSLIDFLKENIKL